MTEKPYLYLCKNCRHKGVYDEGDDDNFENWFCWKTKLLTSYVPCTNIKSCEVSKQFEMEKFDLESCPLCDGEAVLKITQDSDGQLCPRIARIECTECGCSTRKYYIDGYYGSKDTIADCVENWNKRVAIKSTPVKHGHWNVGYFHDRVCSCCLHPDNDLNDYAHDYCPNCGCKMGGETT